MQTYKSNPEDLSDLSKSMINCILEKRILCSSGNKKKQDDTKISPYFKDFTDFYEVVFLFIFYVGREIIAI